MERSRVADILMEQGYNTARALREQGQISADMWSRLGQIPGEAVQQYQQTKRQDLQNKIGGEELKQFERQRQGHELGKNLYQQHATVGDDGHLQFNHQAIADGYAQAGFPELGEHHLDLMTKLEDNVARTQQRKLDYETSKQKTYADSFGSVMSVPPEKRADAYTVWHAGLSTIAKKDPVFGSLPDVYPGDQAFNSLYESHRTNAERLAARKEAADEYAKGLKETPAGGELGHVDPVTGVYTKLAQGAPDPAKGMIPIPPGGKVGRMNPATGQVEILATGGPPAGAEDKERHELETERLAREALGETRQFHREEAAARRASGAKDKLVRVEHMDDATGRTVVEWLPQSELAGRTFRKGVGGTVESRIASAQAVNQTGEDIISQLKDPSIAAKLGPIMGRYNTLRDFIGNPPPELSEIAGSIESYALANMGVHGMRSAQGAEQIKKLMDQKHTPESLIATIRGLNKFSSHFMENEGRGTTGAGPGVKPASGRMKVVGPNGQSGTVPEGTALPPGWSKQ